MADIVPFGKYKNQPVEVLAQDKDYCEWLSGQSWVAQRFPAIHTLIINNFAEPTETPEHNALQLCFLDEALRLKVSCLLALYKRPYARWFRQETYMPFFVGCETPTFEEQAIDVQWNSVLWYPYYNHDYRFSVTGKELGEHSYHWTQYEFRTAVECKPSLGDDYPAVLRFMHSLVIPYSQLAYKAVVVEQCTFRGGTIEQVRELFQASGVLLLDMQSLTELADIPCMTEESLPPAQHYSNKRERRM